MSFVRLTRLDMDRPPREVLWPLSRIQGVTARPNGSVVLLQVKNIVIDIEVAESFDEVEKRLKAAARDAVFGAWWDAFPTYAVPPS